ncbi:unnamed protein product [Caenorhabditis auriculariae]|uniref:Evolutionarily conserved signaling intermediate in Toll pathway, mitochondrial n=1 Tax=Caenorhabditis auriculariae TaxID=2777116 RepID=A0A8S1HK54_9PELO|nr:unnamed protein product [Caenorhabditis auriculariae]
MSKTFFSLFRSPSVQKGCRLASNAAPVENRLVHIENQFESVPPPKRDKDAFMGAIAMFKEKRGRGHVEFINSSLKFIKEYGVHKDLDTYKALLNVFPKGKMIPQNTFQKIFLHYPMQQNCCVKVLDEMEWHGVQPDKEIHDIVVNAFGEWNFATKKIKRMLYWMPKLKYSNKYLDRRTVEGKSLSDCELAGVALKMMSRDPATNVSLVKFKNDIMANEWIVLAQSPSQQRLLKQLNAGDELTTRSAEPLQEFVKEEMDEDYTNWYEDWLKRRESSKRTIHEQQNEVILALGAIFRYDNDTAFRWVEELQKTNKNLENLRIRLRIDGKSLI